MNEELYWEIREQVREYSHTDWERGSIQLNYGLAVLSLAGLLYTASITKIVSESTLTSYILTGVGIFLTGLGLKNKVYGLKNR